MSDADLRTIALWELMRGAEKAVPDIKGRAEAYLKSLSKHEIDLIRRYDKIRNAESAKLADLFEKDARKIQNSESQKLVKVVERDLRKKP